MSNFSDEALLAALTNNGVPSGAFKFEERNSYLWVSLASGVVQSIFQTPVTISKIIVNSASAAFTAYDNASGASGTTFLNIDSATAPYTLNVGARLVNGLTITGPALASTKLTFVYRL